MSSPKAGNGSARASGLASPIEAHQSGRDPETVEVDDLDSGYGESPYADTTSLNPSIELGF